MSPPTLNPVMIKELRQLVRGRFIAGILVTFLAAQLVIIGTYVLSDPSLAVSATGRAAQPLLRVLLGALSMACCLCVPAYVGIRFSLEHQPGNADLLFVTTLTPGMIVRGKLYSGILTTALLMSVSMPYMTFIYLLRGIDLPTVFSALAFVFLMSVALIQFAICIGALPTSRAFKGLSALGLAGFVSSAGMVPVMLVYEFASGRHGSSPLSTVQLGILLTFLLFFACFHAFSVALITPHSANRSLPVRVVLTVVWAVCGGLAIRYFLIKTHREPICVWAFCATILSALALVISVGERDTLNARIRRSIPRWIPFRALAFPFFSGAANGVIWAFLLATTSLAIMLTLARKVALGEPAFRSLPTLFVYALAYTLTAALIRRWLLAAWVPARHTGAIALLLAAAGTVLPFVLGLLIKGVPERDLYSAPLWHLGIIVELFYIQSEPRQAHTLFAAGWAAVVLILNARWLAGQVWAFRPMPSLNPSSSNSVQEIGKRVCE